MMAMKTTTIKQKPHICNILDISIYIFRKLADFPLGNPQLGGPNWGGRSLSLVWGAVFLTPHGRAPGCTCVCKHLVVCSAGCSDRGETRSSSGRAPGRHKHSHAMASTRAHLPRLILVCTRAELYKKKNTPVPVASLFLEMYTILIDLDTFAPLQTQKLTKF